ncbi:MAG: DsbA family protein [Candidatus Limnocylindrales bacterium]
MALIGIPALVLLVLVAAAALGGSKPADGILVRADSPTLGRADAPVTLVEFLDPECESCRAFNPILKQLLAEYRDEVRLVVRYVAGHANSSLAVIALEAAREQSEDGYWAMLDLLYERQPEWGEREDPQSQAFLDAAAAVGLDIAPIEAAMTKGDLTLIKRDLADARKAGVDGTPTFFVNGAILDGPTPDALRAAIDAALGR